MGIDSPALVRAQIERARAAIERDATATAQALSEPAPAPGRQPPGWPPPEHQTLQRQLASLATRVTRAEAHLADPRELRAELATLAYFAGTLRADAQAWRASLSETLARLARQEATARRERVRAAAERDAILRRRDLLQARIDRMAAEVARTSGECRRTVPVIRLVDDVTVSSITVSRPRRRFGPNRLWLVTLGADRDQVLVRPD